MGAKVIEYPLLVIQAGIAEPFESTVIVFVSPALASLITSVRDPLEKA